MEKAIEKLKEIGVREISKTTKISINKLDDIIEKRFSNLQRVRVVGFLKILEREYKVDLSEWLKEYDENFFAGSQATQEVEDVEHSVNNLDLDTQKQKDDLIEERKKQLISRKRFYISLIVVVVILGGYFGYKSIFMKSPSPSKHSPLPQQEHLTTPEESPAVEEETSQQETSNIEEENASDGLTEDVSDEAMSAPVPQDNVSKSEKSHKEQIVVIPNRSLWIEVLDLSSKQKFQTIVNTPYPIEVKNDRLLISFGHGDFSLQTNTGVAHYEKPYPMRFLYTPKEGVKQIKYAQYLELSGQN
ncbi:hypothetical protein [Helicobacter sp. 11S02596-1]|uniref:hypothetical protein n=1 Tax=Helicobacter sp. 11S02596-1 TaxID=1476194 RepID=UPI000BA6BFBE|nr:hypothetical protein [Helicobacter sp. 11S02596-1]PAF45044.1 hypothetical protein BJI48_00270 [Helicobacter sp. 11S02596-1]